MSNVMINDTNLTNIANAIREKNGTDTTYKPSEMANAILAIESGGGGYMPTTEDLTYDVSDSTPFTDGQSYWIIREFGKNPGITFKYPSLSSTKFFNRYPGAIFDANIVFNEDAACMPVKNLFEAASNMKEITGTIRFPNNTNNFARIDSAENMFKECFMLRSIRDDFIDSSFCHWFNRTGSSYNKMNTAFSDCYSLREIPKFYFEMIGTNTNGEQPGINSANNGYTYLFRNCYALDKIEGLPVILSLTSGSTITSNMFAATFDYCHNLHKLTFQTNADGTPLTAKWTGQIIDLTDGMANSATIDGATWCASSIGVGGFYTSSIYSYNSGYLQENLAGYTYPEKPQFYVGDGLTTYWTNDRNYSKYGHTEAVETINSLPDTSAVGGGNTIKFAAKVGQYTDYLKGRTNDININSIIETLTEAEIAVATAKGWTVTLV